MLNNVGNNFIFTLIRRLQVLRRSTLRTNSGSAVSSGIAFQHLPSKIDNKDAEKEHVTKKQTVRSNRLLLSMIFLFLFSSRKSKIHEHN